MMLPTLTLPSTIGSPSGALNIRSAVAAERYLSLSPSAGVTCEYGPLAETFIDYSPYLQGNGFVEVRGCFLLTDTSLGKRVNLSAPFELFRRGSPRQSLPQT